MIKPKVLLRISLVVLVASILTAIPLCASGIKERIAGTESVPLRAGTERNTAIPARLEVFVIAENTVHLFADIAKVRVAVVFDPDRIKEASFVLGGEPAPYEVVSAAKSARKEGQGDDVVLVYDLALRCFECLPVAAQDVMPQSMILTYELRNGGTGAVEIRLPAFRVASRLSPIDIAMPRFSFAPREQEVPPWEEPFPNGKAFFIASALLSVFSAVLGARIVLKRCASRRIQKEHKSGAASKRRPAEEFVLKKLPGFLMAEPDDARTRRAIAHVALWVRWKMEQGVFPRDVAFIAMLERQAFGSAAPDKDAVRKACERLQSEARYVSFVQHNPTPKHQRGGRGP